MGWSWGEAGLVPGRLDQKWRRGSSGSWRSPPASSSPSRSITVSAASELLPPPSSDTAESKARRGRLAPPTAETTAEAPLPGGAPTPLRLCPALEEAAAERDPSEGDGEGGRRGEGADDEGRTRRRAAPRRKGSRADETASLLVNESVLQMLRFLNYN